MWRVEIFWNWFLAIWEFLELKDSYKFSYISKSHYSQDSKYSRELIMFQTWLDKSNDYENWLISPNVHWFFVCLIYWFRINYNYRDNSGNRWFSLKWLWLISPLTFSNYNTSVFISSCEKSILSLLSFLRNQGLKLLILLFNLK